MGSNDNVGPREGSTVGSVDDVGLEDGRSLGACDGTTVTDSIEPMRCPSAN